MSISHFLAKYLRVVTFAGLLLAIVLFDAKVTALSSHQVSSPMIAGLNTTNQSDRIGSATGGHFSFESPTSIVPFESDTSVLLAVDLDRDGQVDIVYSEGLVLQIARNIAGLDRTWDITRSVGMMAEKIVGLDTGDLNRDGRSDLVTASGTDIQIWGNPHAAFSETWVVGTVLTTPVAVQQGTLAVADLDRDGALDIIAGGADGVVRMWRNPLVLQDDLTTPWSTVQVLPALEGAVTALGIGDLDRDGRLDLIIVSDGAGPTIRLWRNPGAPFNADWTESADLVGAGTLSLPAGRRLVVIDLDGDNCLDVAVGTENGTLRAWRNPGTAPFSKGWGTGLVLGSVAGDLRGIISADLNHDAKPELVGVVESTPTQVIAWESGVGPFDTAWTMHLLGTDNDFLTSIRPANLDQDGDLDLVTSGGDGIKAWPNQSAPWAVGFDSTGHSAGVNGAWTMALAVSDLDGDGYSDLVTGEINGQIMAWRNDGTPFDGDWTGHQVGEVTDWWTLTGLAAGDLDNDGDIDLVAGYYHPHGPTIWQNDGHPFESEWSWRQIGNQRVGALKLADIDGDGRLDIVSGGGLSWANTPSDEYKVMVWHAPEAPFSDTWSVTEVGLAYYSVLSLDVGDLDNDGDLDIVIGTYHAPPVGDVHNPVPQDQWPDVYQIRAFRNDGGGQWTEFNVGRDPAIETLGLFYHGFWGATITHVALADLDHDGNLDIVATQKIEGDFMLMGWQNDGTPFSGELWAPSAVAVGENHSWLNADLNWVEPGDLDRDGDLDLVAGSREREPHQVMVWENSGLAFGTVISETTWVRHNIGALGEDTWTGSVADLDRDGDLDLIAVAFVSMSGEIRLWENDVAPDLALDVTPDGQAISLGHVVTYTAMVTGLYGFDRPVNLWVSGLPAGIATAWSCNPLLPSGSSVLTLTLPLDSLAGEYSLLAVATGENIIRTVPFTLTVIEQTYQTYLPLLLRTRWTGR